MPKTSEAPRGVESLAFFFLCALHFRHQPIASFLRTLLASLRTLLAHLQDNKLICCSCLVLVTLPDRQYVSFDLSLARGLTYYTGLIYECVVVDGGIKVCFERVAQRKYGHFPPPLFGPFTLLVVSRRQASAAVTFVCKLIGSLKPTLLQMIRQ